MLQSLIVIVTKSWFPANVSPLNSRSMVVAPVIGVGVGVDQDFWDNDRNDWGRDDRASRPTSVRTSSYEKKN